MREHHPLQIHGSIVLPAETAFNNVGKRIYNRFAYAHSRSDLSGRECTDRIAKTLSRRLNANIIITIIVMKGYHGSTIAVRGSGETTALARTSVLADAFRMMIATTRAPQMAPVRCGTGTPSSIAPIMVTRCRCDEVDEQTKRHDGRRRRVRESFARLWE